MKRLLTITLLIAGMLCGFAHAQSGGQSAAGQIGAAATPAVSVSAPADTAEKGGNSAIYVIGGVVAVALLLGFVLLRGGEKTESHREDRDGPPTYIGGYETIDPNIKRREPPPRPPAEELAARPRTDTIIAPWNVPADFDVPRFLRKAKAYFMRLQASWDKGDVRDIRQFTSTDIFGQFCNQLNQRSNLDNSTEVVTLGAELLGIETVEEDYQAIIKFTGMIKDAPDAQVAPFSEVWSMIKPINGTRSWAITGIQQY